MVQSPSVRVQDKQRYVLARALCWCGVVFGLCFTTYDSIKRWQILHGSSAQARVERLRQEWSKGRAFSYVAATFTTADHEQYWVEFSVEPQRFAHLHQGSPLSVRYRASKPTDALLADDSWLLRRNVGAVLAALGLYAIGRLRWRRWQRQELNPA